MEKERKAFNFYSSFDEVFQELDTEQKGLMIEAILNVQFMRIYIDDVSFDDKILSIVWKSMKHSILKQVDGFCKAGKNSYSRELFAYEADCKPTYEADCKPTSQQVQGQVQGQVQEQEKGAILPVTTKSYDDSLRLAEYLYKNILRLNPNHKKPNLNTWAKDINLAIRIDGRTVEQLKECIDWIYTTDGAFWQKNILSGKKLREKFDTMNIQNMTKRPSVKEQKLNNLDILKAKAMQRDGYSEQQIMEAIGV